MEFFSTFILFIIIPLIGLALITFGILKIRNGKPKMTLFIGIFLLILPLLYLAIISILNLKLENKLAGKYTIGNNSEALVLKDDGTFELKSTINFLNSGTGTWETEEIDFPVLQLHFEGNKEVWLEIKENKNSITLSNMSGSTDITSDLIKLSE